MLFDLAKDHYLRAKSLQFARLVLRLKQEWTKLSGNTGQIYIERRVGEYNSIWRNVAAEIGGVFDELDKDIWRIRMGKRTVVMYQYQLSLDNPVTLKLAARKPLVHRLLRQANLPVPHHVCFNLASLSIPAKFLKNYPDGIVIKPAIGSAGRGVTTNITTQKRIREAALLASLYDRCILAEQQVAGECYRVLIFREKALSVVRRSGVAVTGDGDSTLRNLVSASAEIPDAIDIETDADITLTLAAQHLDWGYVPRRSLRVLVRSTQCSKRELEKGELKTTYDCDVSSIVGANITDAAIRAARVIGSEFLGVDVITTDIKGDLGKSGGIINEVNTTPALHNHYDRHREKFPKPALTIIKTLLSKP